jgi:hypothetical protein
VDMKEVENELKRCAIYSGYWCMHSETPYAMSRAVTTTMTAVILDLRRKRQGLMVVTMMT